MSADKLVKRHDLLVTQGMLHKAAFGIPFADCPNANGKCEDGKTSVSQ